MPFGHRRFGRFRRRPHFRRHRGTRVGPALHRTRWTRGKRVAQNLTREVRWFKTVNTISTTTSNGWLKFNVQADSADCSLQETLQFTKYGTIWDEYKILKVVAKFYPAHVGSESVVSEAASQTLAPRFFRGNVVTWIDPQGDSQLVTNIISVMGKPSAKLSNPRRFLKRWMDRPRSGYPTWGHLDPQGIIQTKDPWNGQIRLFGEGFTPQPLAEPNLQVYYFAEVLYKILFRSRQES